MNNIVKQLLNPKSEQERKALEKAVVAIALRIPSGTPRAKSLIEQLSKTGDIKTRVSLLEVCGKIGDPLSLPVLRSALNDKNNEIKTAVIRAFSDWPNSEVLNDLYNVAQISDNETHSILALRGYVKLISQSQEKSAEELLKLYSKAMELAKTVKEKQEVLSGISNIKSMDALKFTKKYIDNPDLQQEASAAVINIASGINEGRLTELKSLLIRVTALIESKPLKEKGHELINITERFEDFITLWQVSGPYDMENQDLFEYSFSPELENPDNVQWQTVPNLTDENRYWHINLVKIYPNQGMVAYLRTRVWSEKNQELQLQVGSNDMVKVWLNKKMIHAYEVARTITAGEDKIKVSLQQGWNTLLLKIVNEGGGWGGCARFRNLDGGHIEGLKFSIK